MNNSKIVLDNLVEEPEIDLEGLQIKQGELTQLIEAINRIDSSEDWQKLKKMFLEGVVFNLERQLINESGKKEINLNKMYRLQGELAWAKKYADLKKLAEQFRQQLKGLENNIKSWHEKSNDNQ